MNRYQRMALNCSLALLFVAGTLVAISWSRTHAASPKIVTPYNFIHYFGTSEKRMSAAVQNIWPQQTGPYCAIATAMAVVNYVDEEDGLAMRFTSRSQQYSIAADNRKAGASQWGYATPVNEYAGVTNIAPDRGVDPRSAAYIQQHYAPAGTVFHNYIYRWQFHSSTEPAFPTQAQQATISLFRAWKTYSEPMSVIINGGEHSVIVTGGWARVSLYQSDPLSVIGLIIRDPMFAGSVSRFEVSEDEWVDQGANWGAGYYTLWSRYYGQRADGSINTDDPEPTVGIYTPTASQPVHWYHGFSWIQRDNHTTDGLSSPDWAFTDMGNELTAP